ncbi:MAG: hypothetical protein D3906_04275, partial [Candidatus Electrothrix sp. AUS1_2]|nr:hypothetical protein [Candidatus Electrothrix sp. AUS1_2]
MFFPDGQPASSFCQFRLISRTFTNYPCILTYQTVSCSGSEQQNFIKTQHASQRMSTIPKNARNILIRSTNWIGDAIMTTPAIRSIRHNFPDARITLLALPWVADVFRACPHIDDIFIYDKQGRHQGLRGKLRLANELRRQNCDLATPTQT